MNLSGIVNSLICLMLVATLIGCAHSKPGAEDKAAGNEVAVELVPVLEDVSTTRSSLDTAFKQLKRGDAKVVLKLDKSAGSMNAALTDVRRVSGKSIISMVEYEGWYWFASSVVRNERGWPRVYIAGYAVEKGGRQVIEWSVW